MITILGFNFSINNKFRSKLQGNGSKLSLEVIEGSVFDFSCIFLAKADDACFQEDHKSNNDIINMKQLVKMDNVIKYLKKRDSYI